MVVLTHPITNQFSFSLRVNLEKEQEKIKRNLNMSTCDSAIANFRKYVERAWNEANIHSTSIREVLEKSGNSLNEWNQKKFGNVQTRVKVLKKKIGVIREMFKAEENRLQEEKETKELDEWQQWWSCYGNK